MVDPFLVISAVVISVLLLFGVVLLVIVYGSPDDKGEAWFPRIVTVIGLWLAFASMLILPWDVAAHTSYNGDGGVDASVLWLIVYITTAVMVTVIIPFAFFYYENDMDPDEQVETFWDGQIGQALKYTLIMLGLMCLAFFIMYAYLNVAHIPVSRIAQSASLVYTSSTWNNQTSNADMKCLSLTVTQAIQSGFALTGAACQSGLFYWEIPVSYPLYVVAFFAFLGWWFFCSFVGVGFFARPMDLINSYRTRPTPMSTKVYFEQRQLLGQRVKALLELAEQMQNELEKGGKSVMGRQRDKQDFRALEKNYFYLKKDYQILYVAHKLKGGNPLVPFFELFLGLCSMVISACWFIHICIFILPPRPSTQFLNTFFIQLTDGVPSFPLFGVLAFTIFSFYLFFCVIKGNFRLGVRFLVFKIYPMEIGNTLMNAFLLNTLIILLTSIPAVQFCLTAFPVYARFTEANVMFGNQIKYLTFFRYFYTNNFFIIFLLCISLLTILFLFLFPNNKAAGIEAQLDRLAKSKNTSIRDYADELK